MWRRFPRVYAATPGKANIAAGRLSQAAATYSNPSTRAPIRLPGGQLIQPGPFSDVADALKAAAGLQQVRTLPDFKLPPLGKLAFDQPIDLELSVERILPCAVNSPTSFSRAVVLGSNGDLAVVDNQRKVIAKFPAAKITAPTECLWISDSLLLVRNAQEMLALNLQNGESPWKVVPKQLPDVPEVSDTTAVQSPLAQEEALSPRAWPRRLCCSRRAQRGIMVNMVQPEPIPDGITELRSSRAKSSSAQAPAGSPRSIRRPASCSGRFAPMLAQFPGFPAATISPPPRRQPPPNRFCCALTTIPAESFICELRR